MTRKLLIAAAVANALLGVSAGATASLIQIGELPIGALGYAPRLLTIQGHGRNTTESGAIGISGGVMVALIPGISDALVFSGNTVTNAGGNTVSPLSNTEKFGIPTLGELNWTSGANVNLLFNAIEPGGDGLTITDITLKFYNGDSVIAAIDGNFAYASTVAGTGSAGFLISVDPFVHPFLDTNVFDLAGASGFHIALESTITGVAAGPESFSALAVVGGSESLSAVAAIPEPETYALMLAGLGLMGMVGARRKKSRK